MNDNLNNISLNMANYSFSFRDTLKDIIFYHPVYEARILISPIQMNIDKEIYPHIFNIFNLHAYDILDSYLDIRFYLNENFQIKDKVCQKTEIKFIKDII